MDAVNNSKLKILLQIYADRIVKQSKENLATDDKAGGNLYNSIKNEVDVEKGVFLLSFFMEDYGKYVDKGVRGVTSTYPKTEAALSKFQYGTGTGRKGGLTEGINEWVKKKRFQFTDKKGKFLSYDSTSYIITRSIWNKGIEANTFFSRPFNSIANQIKDVFFDKFILEVESQSVFGDDKKR